jgi:hypothetical protein
MHKYLILIDNKVYGIEKHLFIKQDFNKGIGRVEFPYDKAIYDAITNTETGTNLFILSSSKYITEIKFKSTACKKRGGNIILDEITVVDNLLNENHPMLRKFKIHSFLEESE